MKITHVETTALNIPVRPERHMVTAHGWHRESKYVLVRVGTDAGIDGVGEATVMPLWSGETVWGTKAILDNMFAPAVIGADPTNIADINHRLDRTARFNWFAKSAIEMACWDIAGKSAGKPIYELLGGAARSLTVECRFSMGAYSLERSRERAQELVDEGFQTIKVKVGGNPEEDIQRVRAVREVIGPNRKLTIDANCGWDADTAIYALNAMQDCNIALNEQPTPDGDYQGLAKVRKATKPPVMADDMCFDMRHAQELVANDACDLISIYPGKNGGISKSKALVEYAAQHGIKCSIGSNLEWDVGTAAMAHVTIACPNMCVEEFPGDMLGPEYHAARIVKNPIEIKGPKVTITNRPGLGVEVDWPLAREFQIS